MQPHGDSRDHIAKQTNQHKNSDRKILKFYDVLNSPITPFATPELHKQTSNVIKRP